MTTGARDPATAEHVLGDLIDAYTRRRQAGAAIDPEAFAAAHPEHAAALRQLLPALEALEEFDPSRGPLPGPAGEAAPKAVGDYRIVREVGRGGMGIVYEAEQLSLGRRVALKILPLAATMDPRHLQRFQNEARAANEIKNEHIIWVRQTLGLDESKQVDDETYLAIAQKWADLAGLDDWRNFTYLVLAGDSPQCKVRADDATRFSTRLAVRASVPGSLRRTECSH